MRFEHTDEVIGEKSGNPTWRFVVEVDAEYVRERLLERGVSSTPEVIERAVRSTADSLWDEGIEGAFDTVCEGLPLVGATPVDGTEHDEVYDESRFFLAIRHGEPGETLRGSISTDDEEVAVAVRAHAEEYPHISVSRKVFGMDDIPFDETEGLGVSCEWTDFAYANVMLSTILTSQFEEEHGRRIDIPLRRSEFDGTLSRWDFDFMRELVHDDCEEWVGPDPDPADPSFIFVELSRLLDVIGDAVGDRDVRLMFRSES